jgi:hypothetical protein
MRARLSRKAEVSSIDHMPAALVWLAAAAAGWLFGWLLTRFLLV